VEEIMRIDGLDNVEIPALITIAPSVETLADEQALREKMFGYLTGLGFNEIFTNSITNSAYYSEETLHTSVKMLNSLSAELDVLRPSMLQTGLEAVAYNLNRKNNDIRLCEFGKTYHTTGGGAYTEQEQVCLYVSGNKNSGGWSQPATPANLFYIKGVCEKLFAISGINITSYQPAASGELAEGMTALAGADAVATMGLVDKAILQRFDIKHPVFYASIHWEKLAAASKKAGIVYAEVPRFPAVNRDLALVVDTAITYQQLQETTQKARLDKLSAVQLFDVFESDKLGAGKKSMAISLTFSDTEKTLTDKEIDSMIKKLTDLYTSELSAVIRN
jgi:phenylalanyl-tRNA synthetase beta chain